MSYCASDNLSAKMQEILEELDSSGSSEAIAVADCLNTIAENGDDQATDEHMLCCAEEIRDYAQRVIDNLGPTKKRCKHV